MKAIVHVHNKAMSEKQTCETMKIYNEENRQIVPNQRLLQFCCFQTINILSYDIASGSEITPCNKIDKPLVVYRFSGNIMKSITTLLT